MERMHIFEYAPILIGARKRYVLPLPVDAVPRVFKTMTSDMYWWYGQVDKIEGARAQATVWDEGRVGHVTGILVSPLSIGHPCLVMEKLNVDGQIDFMIGIDNILQGNDNFVNFGIPCGKHVRIDIYTGESKVIE